MATKRTIKKQQTPEKLTEFIKVYLTPSEYAMVQRAAEISDFRKISVYARTVILDAIRKMQQPNGNAA